MKKLLLILLCLPMIGFGQNWNQRGNDLDGEAPGDLSGNSVSLSSDGNTVAIGAQSNDENGSSSGHVRVFVNNATSSIIEDYNQFYKKKLLKKIDVLGRETNQINQPLFYIYDDGTVEKRIMVE